MSHKIWWLVRKDISESLGNKQVFLPMIILPIILCVALPGAMILISIQTGNIAMNGTDLIEKTMEFYSIPETFSTITERLLYIFLNYTFMPMLLIIPLMVSVSIAANSIAGEKERQTLETLLYTPLSNVELVTGKILSAFIPAMVISLGSIILYFITADGLYFALRGELLLTSLSWLPVIFLLNPALALLGLSVAVLVGIKAKSQIEAQQTAAMVVLPVVLLVVGQIGGIVVLNPLMVILISLGILVLDWFLATRFIPKFNRDKIIQTL